MRPRGLHEGHRGKRHTAKRTTTKKRRPTSTAALAHAQRAGRTCSEQVRAPMRSAACPPSRLPCTAWCFPPVACKLASWRRWNRQFRSDAPGFANETAPQQATRFGRGGGTVKPDATGRGRSAHLGRAQGRPQPAPARGRSHSRPEQTRPRRGRTLGRWGPLRDRRGSASATAVLQVWRPRARRPAWSRRRSASCSAASLVGSGGCGLCSRVGRDGKPIARLRVPACAGRESFAGPEAHTRPAPCSGPGPSPACTRCGQGCHHSRRRRKRRRAARPAPDLAARRRSCTLTAPRGRKTAQRWACGGAPSGSH